MDLFTSYYANYRNIPEDFLCIGISRTVPDGFVDKPNFIHATLFAPPADLLHDMKSGNETEEGYKKRYVTYLFSVFNDKSIFGNLGQFVSYLKIMHSENYKSIVFLCYEKKASSPFCF